MKLTITLAEDFNDAAAATLFVAKLQAVLSMSNSAFEAAYKNVAALVSNPATAPAAPVAATAPMRSAAGGASPVEATVAAKDETALAVEAAEKSFLNVADTARGEPLAVSSPSPAPAETAPKARRGRPSKADQNIPAALDTTAGVASVPAVKSAGAAGVAAPIAPQAIAQAISAGAEDAEALRAFQTEMRGLIDRDMTSFMALLKDYKIKSVRELPVEKRAEFLAKMRSKVEMAEAAKAA